VVARLHADSWRRHYRGVYSDAFLDGDVHTDRLAVWSERLCKGDGVGETILAEDDGSPVGFIHVVFDQDPRWGSLVDNLHVAFRLQRRGLGASLMKRAATDVIERSPSSGLYLWVLEQNTSAQAFYEARGGREVEREAVTAPGGVPGRLDGAPQKLRYVWSDPAVLSDG
jgi:GNAT superfamily N-acetyltransferase